MSKSTTVQIIDMIKTPLGFALIVVILAILASISAASAISGQLTAAAISGAGFISIIMILAAVALVGK
jgi:hypothetical protein